MKLKEHSTGFNEKSFEPTLELTISLPLTTLQDSEAMLDKEDIIQTLGMELYNVLIQVQNEKSGV